MTRKLDYIFQFYNPLTDQHFVPKQDDIFFQDTRIPQSLLITLPKAKMLVEGLDMDSIRSIAKSLDKLRQQGSILQLEQWDQLTSGEEIYSDPAEEVRIALAEGDHGIPPAMWAPYMGVLALTVIGNIYCELFPTPEYRKDNSPLSEIELNYLPGIVDRATAYGEIFCDKSRDHEKASKRGRETGNRANSTIKKILDEGLTWYLALPANHGFRSTTEAAKTFLKNHPQQNYIRENSTARTLVTKIHKRLTELGIRH